MYLKDGPHPNNNPELLSPSGRHTLTLAGLGTFCSPIGTKVGAFGLNPLGGWGGLLVGDPFSGERLGCTGLEGFWPCLDSSGVWWRHLDSGKKTKQNVSRL